MTSQALGRRNAAPVQSTPARPGPPGHPCCTTHRQPGQEGGPPSYAEQGSGIPFRSELPHPTEEHPCQGRLPLRNTPLVGERLWEPPRRTPPPTPPPPAT